MLTNYKQSSCQTNKRSFPFQLIACNNVGMSVAGWSHAIFVSGARAVYSTDTAVAFPPRAGLAVVLATPPAVTCVVVAMPENF